MPRGRKAVINYDEEIMKIDMQITKWKNTILELQTRRRELVAEKERAELDSLYRAVQESGKSVQDILSMLEGPSAPVKE